MVDAVQSNSGLIVALLLALAYGLFLLISPPVAWLKRMYPMDARPMTATKLRLVAVLWILLVIAAFIIANLPGGGVLRNQ